MTATKAFRRFNVEINVDRLHHMLFTFVIYLKSKYSVNAATHLDYNRYNLQTLLSNTTVSEVVLRRQCFHGKHYCNILTITAM